MSHKLLEKPVVKTEKEPRKKKFIRKFGRKFQSNISVKNLKQKFSQKFSQKFQLNILVKN